MSVIVEEYYFVSFIRQAEAIVVENIIRKRIARAINRFFRCFRSLPLNTVVYD